MPAPPLVTAVLCAALAATAVTAVSRHPVVVVVSFDGFRPDYLERGITPHLARFRDESARPPYMRPAFPTKTFVNHYTMATGMNPETHGVIDNYMFNDTRDGMMRYKVDMFRYDESIVPIWMQNEYSGDGRHSGVMMWPGSELKYQHKLPTHIGIYNRSMLWTSRVDTIISWIMDEKYPANLIMAYFEEPDNTGHQKGVESQEVNNQIVRVDVLLKYFIEQIKDNNLNNKVNLIIVSDHGMRTVPYANYIHLDKYGSEKLYTSVLSGPNGFVYPNPGKYNEVYSTLKKGALESGQFSVYKQFELLDRWHFKNSQRLKGLIYLLAKPNFAFWEYYIEKSFNDSKSTEENFRTGVHGFDNEDPIMRALFMASGPAFKKNFVAQPFNNIDLFPLISHVLRLKDPPENVLPNGTMAGVQQLLMTNDSKSGTVVVSPRVQGILAVVFLHAIACYL